MTNSHEAKDDNFFCWAQNLHSKKATAAPISKRAASKGILSSDCLGGAWAHSFCMMSFNMKRPTRFPTVPKFECQIPQRAKDLLNTQTANCHLVQHLSADAWYKGNPRFYTTDWDESLNKVFCKIAATCHKTTMQRKLFAKYKSWGLFQKNGEFGWY